MKRFVKLFLVLSLMVGITAPGSWASLRYFDTDRLNEGASHTLTLRFKKGGTYMVVAAASQGGVDFDMTVIDPDGDKVISSDDTDENTDWVRFTAGMEGDYKIRITAYKGSGWYEMTIFDTLNY